MTRIALALLTGAVFGLLLGAAASNLGDKERVEAGMMIHSGVAYKVVRVTP